MSNPNGPVPDDKPSIRYIKIKMDPKGEIAIGVNGGNPNNYSISVLQVTPNPGHSEPNCINTPFPAGWDVGRNEYIGLGIFEEGLTPALNAYTVDSEFVKVGKPGIMEPPHSADVVLT